MRSAEAVVASTDRAHATVVVAALPACRLAAAAQAAVVAAASVAVAEAGGAAKRPESQKIHDRRNHMKSTFANRNLSAFTFMMLVAVCVCLSAFLLFAAEPSAHKAASAETAPPALGAQAFSTPEQAANALINAAEKFDVVELTQIFGLEGKDIVLSGEYAQDRKHATEFAAQAREKNSVSIDPKTRTRAFFLVGKEDWPFPVPLVKHANSWYFDAKAGRQELVYRRIGSDELDAIEICRGYVEAQHEYALQPRAGYDVNQYAQRIVSSPGKQDGLAWQEPDGAWGGPIGEKIARAIEQGYTSGSEPYHGYFFKILKGQGPAAPLGRMDFVVKGVMIGGFALVAAPAEYGVTGIKTFIVSHDGVVYEKDLGPKTLEQFKNMELYNPDKSWSPVQDTSKTASM